MVNNTLRRMREDKFNKGYRSFSSCYINKTYLSLLLVAKADKRLDNFIKGRSKKLFKRLGALCEKPKALSRPLFNHLSKYVLYPDKFCHRLSGTVKRTIQSLNLIHLQNIINNTRDYAAISVDRNLDKFWSPFKKKYTKLHGEKIYSYYLTMVGKDKDIKYKIDKFKNTIVIKYL